MKFTVTVCWPEPQLPSTLKFSVWPLDCIVVADRIPPTWTPFTLTVNSASP